MLLSYSFSNFKSFKEEATLNMVATSQTSLNDVLIRKNNLRVLPSAVIYGANASGKSNIIKSIRVLSNIISSGTISDTKNSDSFELFPFFHDSIENPINFSTEFINNGSRYKYVLSVMVHKGELGYRKIHLEELMCFTKSKEYVTLFKRLGKKVTVSKDRTALKIMKITDSMLETITDMVNNNMNETDLFLALGFKSSINSIIASDVIEFFTKRLFILDDIYFKDAMYSISSNSSLPRNLWTKCLENVTKVADFGPQHMCFRVASDKPEDRSAPMVLFSEYQVNNKKLSVNSEFTESRGTIKLIGLSIILSHVYKTGGVLIIDEFDAALHPEIAKGIIMLFNDSDSNKNGAQFIFTSHNPIYLDNSVFRRDQILFVDKSPYTYSSFLYSLADFGSEKVRNDENYLRNYFKGKYTSMPFIDFSSIISAESEQRSDENGEK